VRANYKGLKDEIKARGWVESLNPFQVEFDFKWVINDQYINFGYLKPNQIVNVFQNDL